MKYVLRFSGEHPTLPRAELEAVLQSECAEYEIEESDRLAIVDSEGEDPAFVTRLAYTLSSAELVAESKTVDGLAADVFDSICDAGTFRVTGSPDVQKRLGGLLFEFGLEVDLKRPDTEVLVYKVGDRYLAGVRLKVNREYQQRRPQYRPYFHPTSMHPKLARALVNLARVAEGDVVLDPFCGSGGILIEAGLMGMRVRGGDIDPNMIEGCIQNMKEFDLTGDVKEGNALEQSGLVDAIATDPPYGRSSHASEDTQVLYQKFIKGARGLLDEGSYMTLMAPSERRIESPGFDVVDTFDVYIHKSLTRRVWVLEAV